MKKEIMYSLTKEEISTARNYLELMDKFYSYLAEPHSKEEIAEIYSVFEKEAQKLYNDLGKLGEALDSLFETTNPQTISFICGLL